MDNTMIAAVLALGDKGLMAFIIYKACDSALCLIIISLSTWGIRAAWRHMKTNGR